jgi:hypothetical protein
VDDGIVSEGVVPTGVVTAGTDALGVWTSLGSEGSGTVTPPDEPLSESTVTSIEPSSVLAATAGFGVVTDGVVPPVIAGPGVAAGGVVGVLRGLGAEAAAGGAAARDADGAASGVGVTSPIGVTVRRGLLDAIAGGDAGSGKPADPPGVACAWAGTGASCCVGAEGTSDSQPCANSDGSGVRPTAPTSATAMRPAQPRTAA